MATKIDEAWERFLLASGLVLSGETHLVSANEMKRLGGAEPRLMAKFDRPDQLPAMLQRHGYTLWPVRNGHYLLAPGTVFFEVPPVTETAPWEPVERFPLVTALRGQGESQYIDHAFNTGLLAAFTGCDPLFLTIRGRERTGRFTFSFGAAEVQVDGVQIEVDAGYEGPRDVFLVEAKVGRQEQVNIRQLYYPWRHFKELARPKTVHTLLLTYDLSRTRYELHEIAFWAEGSPLPARVIGSAAYRLCAPEQRRVDELVTGEPTGRGLAPQADDLNRILLVVKAVGAGLQTADELGEYLGLTPRQGRYYRGAAAYLGLVETHGAGLTRAGLDLLRAGHERQRLGLARAVVNSWVVRDLLQTGDPITLPAIVSLLAEVPGPDGQPRYTGATPARRARTIWSWLAWLSEEVGCFRLTDDQFEPI